jgi:hypothetical protein
MTPPFDERKADEARGRMLMTEGAEGLVDGIDRLGAQWVLGAVRTIVERWGGLEDAVRRDALEAAATAGREAATRVSSELRALFAVDPADQRATPLEIIRSLRREATAVLMAAGVPEVERDPYEARAFPDDVYGIVLKSPNDLGDDGLGGALLAWGIGKAEVLRAYADNQNPD